MSTVYVSACLAQRHPDVHLAMSTALAAEGVPLVEVPSTNVWIRDWAPIKCGNRFVRFKPKADTIKWPFLKAPECLVGKLWDGAGIPDHSDIILDGGNVVRSPDGKRVIMCTQTLFDNPMVYTKELERLLEAEIIWIPNEPFDTLGHSDGECAFIDDDAVFVNDFRSMRDVAYRDYQWELRGILRQHDIEAVPFPNAYDECRDITEERFRKEHPDADDFNMATGFYLNAIKTGNLVLYPTFSIDRDERCLDCLLDAWPDAKCVGVDCGYLAEEGGLLHCVSAEF